VPLFITIRTNIEEVVRHLNQLVDKITLICIMWQLNQHPVLGID
jgi:hypothetical protein